MRKHLKFTVLAAMMAILVSAVGCPPAPDSQQQPTGPDPMPGVTDVPTTTPETPEAEEPAAQPPKEEEAKAEEPKAEAPKEEEVEAPKMEPPKTDAPKPEEAKAEPPKPEEAKAEPPKKEAPKMEPPKTEEPKADAPKPEEAKADAPKPEKAADTGFPPVGKPELLVKLPAGCNTPDGMCLLEDGNVILSMPNFNKLDEGARLMKITPDNKVEKFLELGKHPETGDLIGPLGVCLAPNGDLFLADYQMNGKKQSRVLRIPMKDGKPGEPVPAVEGFHVSNAVICYGGYLYVSETQIDVEAQPGTSGVLRFKLEDLDKGVIKLADDITKDPHFLGIIEIHNKEVRFGADGLCLDKAGNLYCGNFADGTLHRFEFDDEGNVKSNKIFATADFMKCCDGLFFNPKTEEVLATDSVTNAVHAINMDAKVRTIVRNGDTDGLDGGMDQPCEVLIRGNELIASNMDWPIPGCVNKEYDEPCTLSVIKLED